MRAGALAVLANGRAGKGRHAGLRTQVVQRLAGAGREVRLLSAGNAAEALAAARSAVDGGAAGLVAVGGDGTVHLALQAVAGTGVPLGIVPTGTGNDIAVELGLPADPLRAADAAAEALRLDRWRPFDLARLSGAGTQRWYAGVLGAGFDAIVNEHANRMRFPRGPSRYDLAILLELARLRPRRYRLVLDGEPQELDAVLVAVANTASYGGGMRICPAADPADGMLDVLVAGPLSRWELLRIKPLVYAGTHVEHPAVRTFRARKVELSGEELVSYADGEQAYPLPITVTAVPDALQLLV